MGSTMKPTIFNERVARALKHWHHNAKKHIKQNQRSGFQSPMTSRPITPARLMSPAHILRHCRSEIDLSPTRLDFEMYPPYESYSPSPSNSQHHNVEANVASSGSIILHDMEMGHLAHDKEQEIVEPNYVSVGLGRPQFVVDVQHSDEFSFSKMAVNQLEE